MQDTDLRAIAQPPGLRGRRRGLIIGVVAVVVLAVAGASWLLAGGDSSEEDAATTATTAASAAPTTAAPATTESGVPDTTAAVAPTTAAPGTTAAPATTVAATDSPWVIDDWWFTNYAFDEQSGVLVSVDDDVTLTLDPATLTVTPSNSPTRPSFRGAPAVAYSPGLDRVVMFGGWADDTWVYDELWLYDVDSDTWEDVPKGEPWPGTRYAAAFASIDSTGGMLLHGGQSVDPGSRDWRGVSDTWYLDTTTMTWTEVGGNEGPAYGVSGFVYDRNADLVVMSTGTQLWTFDPTTMSWARAASPAERRGLGPFLFDPGSNLVISPGLAYSAADDTWTTIPWDLEAGEVAALVPDPDRGRMLVFTRTDTGEAARHEIVAYDLATGTTEVLYSRVDEW